MAITCNFTFNKIYNTQHYSLNVSHGDNITNIIYILAFKGSIQSFFNRELQLYKCFYIIWNTAQIMNQNGIFKKKALKRKKYYNLQFIQLKFKVFQLGTLQTLVFFKVKQIELSRTIGTSFLICLILVQFEANLAQSSFEYLSFITFIT